MENELSEIEKAACYIQMLKQEGKLNEAAIPELLQMYAITQEEAQTLLESFKQTDDYKKSVVGIFKEQIILVVCLVGIGGFFLFAGFGDRDNVNLFAVYGILYALAAFGLIKYLIKLLQERFVNSRGLSWITNKALPYVLTIGVVFVYMQYQFLNESYLINPSKWRVEKNILLTSDCVETRTGGKNPIYFYEFSVENYAYPLRWYKVSHYYAFNKHLLPDIDLHKGDTIIAYISEFKSGNHYISIFNIVKNGETFLNIKERNELAKAEAKENCILMTTAFVIALLVFIVQQVKRKVSVS